MNNKNKRDIVVGAGIGGAGGSQSAERCF